MTYENIKSVILAFLVVSSVFLTWNLWTYQPDYETMKKTNYVEEVSIGEKREIKTIIKPEKILYHYQRAHYGTVNTTDIDKTIREISQWNIYDVKHVTSKIQNFNQLVHGDGNVEIIFPDKVPLSIYKNMLDFQDRKLPKFSFDRIVINMKNLNKETGNIYFVSNDAKDIYISYVSGSDLNDFNRGFLKNAHKLPRYFPYKPNKKRIIFLPETETTMVRNKYFPDYIDSEKFKEALFNDPSFVQKSFIPEGEEFTDGSSKMNIYNDENMLIYINPMEEESDFVGNPEQILQRGIDFINEHGGWTDAYRFVGLDEWNQQLTFRLYSADGYPIFNDGGMSDIIEVWGRNEITKYLRSNFSLDLPLRTEMSEVIIPSGEQILSYFDNQKDFNPELLQDISLGYVMEKDPKEPKLIVLEPTWFYRYNDKWIQVKEDTLRRVRNGLE